jgi:hypothetical protein
MVTTVKLQPPFEYSWWVILITAILGIMALVMLFFVVRDLWALRQKELAPKPTYRKIHMTPEVLRRLKEQYAFRVQAVLNSYSQNRIDKREGYQQLSAIIRSFIHEATGINVENYTKKEIKALGMRKLDVLMEEYYVPEFAEEEKAEGKDLSASCNTAIGVIRSWS